MPAPGKSRRADGAGAGEANEEPLLPGHPTVADPLAPSPRRPGLEILRLRESRSLGCGWSNHVEHRVTFELGSMEKLGCRMSNRHDDGGSFGPHSFMPAFDEETECPRPWPWPSRVHSGWSPTMPSHNRHATISHRDAVQHGAGASRPNPECCDCNVHSAELRLTALPRSNLTGPTARLTHWAGRCQPRVLLRLISCLNQPCCHPGR